MSVHYKFKSALEYDTVTFDGLHISVRDLKNAIIQQKRIGKNTDFDLQVTNAQTKEVYEDEEALIPKNTSLLIARIPLVATNKSKTWEGYGGDSAPAVRTDEGGPIAKAVDLSSLDASEDDKIRAMMSQSTQDYDPSNYLKIRGANQVGVVPPNYRCYKCHQSGHWIKDCPLSQGPEPMEIKKSTGIPRSFMVPVEGPQVQGAMMTPNGSYAVPVLDHQTYTQKQQPAPPTQDEQPEIPEDLVCSICSGLLTDAVMIPCCGNSFCDECIRSCLLESEEHECPDCHERDISPGTLIPNRYLRNSVANFKNTTGYVKRPVYKPAVIKQTEIEKQETFIPKSPDNKDTSEVIKPENTEKTVISEADSTEAPKNVTNADFVKEVDLSVPSKDSPTKSSVSEGPPGVSPRREKSPKRISHRKTSHHSSNHNVRNRRNSKDISPRRRNPRRSPQYDHIHRIEERSGTPTVDEPGMSGNIVSGNNTFPPANAPYPTGPPPSVLPPMMGMPPPHMQGPPPAYSSGQPPPGVFSQPQGPPPNFRLPPPGTNPPSYIPGPYNPVPRPLYDPSRPPIQGPPPNYTNYPPRSRGRDYSTSRMRTRTPPGIIDDPLEAFNRMLREKDERERRAKQRKVRSYSRSSSRSYSRSPKRLRSRSPRRRNSRSRSRSFSISRSRSRSFSPSPRNSPYRDYSPRNTSPRRRPPSRYRSPLRSPPRYRYKDPPLVDRNRDRDYDRSNQRDRERAYSRDREFNYYDRERGRWGGGAPRPISDNYYAPEVHPLQPPNRFHSRENFQPYMNKNEPPHHIPALLTAPIHLNQRRFDDLVPPGIDQPPIPGEEIPQRYDERYVYDRPHNDATKETYTTERDQLKEPDRRNYNRDDSREEQLEKGRERRYDRYSRTPTRQVSPRKSRDRERDHHDKLDKHRRRKHEASPDKSRKDDRHDRKRDNSDDDKGKKSKEKKKKREKKETEKKKRKEKKERKEQDKLKKEEKERKDKDSEIIAEPQKESKNIETERMHEPKEKEMVQFETKNNVESPDKINVDSFMNKELIKEEKPDLYGDLLSEGIDTSIVKNYGKLDDLKEEVFRDSNTPERDAKHDDCLEGDSKEDGEYPPESETSKDDDVLDIHANEAELKAELEKSEVLAPLPEKSKWEMEDESTPTMTESSKYEGKSEKFGKVTNEVIKRAENAIFAKAINAIRPIEIKKISVDRAKLYSGEKDREKDKKLDENDVRNMQVTVLSGIYEGDIHPPGTEPSKVESEIQKPPQRLSVKERLGCKVDDLDRIVRVSYDRNRSRSLSPLSKRARDDRSYIDRRLELDDRRRDDRSRHDRDRHHRNYRNIDRNDSRDSRRRDDFSRRDRDKEFYKDRRGDHRRDDKKQHSKSRSYVRDDDKSKRKRSRSKSDSRDHKHKKKDKKQKKERTKKHRKDEEEKPNEVKTEKREGSILPKSATDRRKPTLDEASFEPDYDLDTESDKEDNKKEKKHSRSKSIEDDTKKRLKIEEKEKNDSSSTDSSDSSSDDEKKRKKHKKHKKKKSKKDSSSSSSSSDSDSSDDEKERKRRKHKKKQKKRKKSKHK